MKTSNKFLVSALLIFLVTLAVYNIALTAAYKKGDFRDKYKYFTSLDHENFDAIKVNAASDIKVEITQGDYQVRVHNNGVDYVKVKQQGNELILDLEYPNERNVSAAGQHVIISLPNLTTLKTDAVYTAGGKTFIKNHLQPNIFFNNYVSVKGFELDSLTIQQDNASIVILEENKIGSLNAVAGISPSTYAKLQINQSNNIQRASLDIRNNSELVLQGVVIPELDLKFSENARTFMSGASLKLLKK